MPVRLERSQQGLNSRASDNASLAPLILRRQVAGAGNLAGGLQQNENGEFLDHKQPLVAIE